MSIDWHKPVRTRHKLPLVGDVRGPHMFVADAVVVALPSLHATTFKPKEWETCWHYGADGRRLRDHEASDFNLENFDPNDGVPVLRLEGR